ncbi:carboxymuconolactone decarboxylase family protein [Bradyrhizobium sp. B124]|uniref:carboxymuconolactone decarboxylase family protein n=1 Tax=Bradyrhizobium sp. B124 TaxID=3140245 RepID=UPI003182D026
MPRLRISTRDDAPPASKPILDSIYRKLGVVPNFCRLIGSSPAALGAFAAFQEGLSGTLDAKTRERIALAVAQVNGSDYCLSAHSYLATNIAKLSPDEIALNRKGGSKSVKAEAVVNFAAKVADQRGRVGDDDIAAVRLAGYDDAQIVEIVALVAENIFTNYLNEVAKTDIDFPVVRSQPG